MNENYYVMERAKRYLELQAAFGKAFEKINAVLLSYPSAGIRVEEINSISKSANVLGHECTFEFCAVDTDGVMVGVINLVDCNFGERKHVTCIYFDRNENWRIEKDMHGWMYHFGSNDETINNFIPHMIGEFLRSKNL